VLLKKNIMRFTITTPRDPAAATRRGSVAKGSSKIVRTESQGRMPTAKGGGET